MRILGIDYGEKRVGIAVSDPLGFTAQGLDPILRKDPRTFLADLAKVCKELEVDEIVIGMPMNMNGTFGPKAKEIQELLPKIEEKIKVPVKTWDERLTSREAGRLMIEEGLSRDKQRKNSDRLAATLILQSYLELKRSTRTAPDEK